MVEQKYPSDRHHRGDLRILLALFVALFCINLLIPRDLWVQDEARYGEVVREMLTTGHWLIPHLNGYTYPDKPPLYFWIVAAVSSVVGQGELAFRLVSVLATLGTIIGVFYTGRALAGRAAGFWAAAIFSTAFVTLIVGQIARMDMLLAAVSVFAWYAVLRFHQTGGKRALAGFWALSALALAVKGPIALLFTVLPGTVWMAVENGRRGLRSLRPLLGLAVIGCMVLAWLAAVHVLGQDQYLRTIWYEQLVGRAVNSWSHREPFYFYVLLLPLLIMPWTGLVVRGARVLLRDRPRPWKAIAVFSLLPLAAISLISGKLFIYVQPLLPALCIAGGIAAANVSERARVSAWLSWPPIVFLAAIGGGVTWISQTYLGHARTQGLAVGIGLLVLAAVGLFLTRANGRRLLWGWVGISLAFSWLVFGALTYLLNPLFSARALGDAVARHATPDMTVGVVHTTRGILNYYAGRQMVEVNLKDAAAWRKSHPDALLIIKTADAKSVFGQAGIPTSCHVNETFVINLKEYHVLAGC